MARELAAAGARVVVLERGEPGAEASAAAAGMLGPQAECDGVGPLLALGLQSLRLYPGTVAALRDETGIDPEYQSDGIVYVALDADDEALLARRHAWQREAGLHVEALAADDVRRREPALGPVRAAFLFPDDHRVDNVRLTRAFAVAAARHGAELRGGAPVRRVVCDGPRAVGVEVGAEVVRAGVVVNAAGAWAADAIPEGRRLPVKPVRGQMVMFATPRPLFRHAIYSRGVYLVPRRDGRLLAGSTYEDVGFDKRVTAAAVGEITRRALRVAPALADATFVSCWAGLRPGTADGLPILGADQSVAGLYHACGHYRNGILLAPVTAKAVAELVLHGQTSYDLRPFTPARFTRVTP